MNAATITKGQRIEYRTTYTQMVNGEFVKTVTNRYGTVVGFFKAKTYVRVLEDGRVKGDSGLISWNDIVRVI